MSAAGGSGLPAWLRLRQVSPSWRHGHRNRGWTSALEGLDVRQGKEEYAHRGRGFKRRQAGCIQVCISCASGDAA